MFAVMLSFIALLVNIYKYLGDSEIGQLMFTSTSDDSRPLSNNLWLRLAVVIFLTGFVIVALTFNFQIYPIVEPFAQSSTGTQAERLAMITSVGPGEDYLFNLMLPNIIILTIWGLVYLIFKYDIKENMAIFLIVILIASFMSSFSIGLLPSFSEAHKGAYQDCQPCYISAGIFNFFMSVGQQLTGMFFFGIPHMANNFLVAVGYMVAYNIAILGLCCLIPNRKKRGDLNGY